MERLRLKVVTGSKLTQLTSDELDRAQECLILKFMLE